MSRLNNVPASLESIFFVTPEQRLLRFLMTECTTSFSPRVLSSKLKGVRGLGGIEGITEILKILGDMNIVLFLNNNREVCLNNDHPGIQSMKIFSAQCDLEGLQGLLEPMTTKAILFGSRATGKARSDSNYNVFVVSNNAEEVTKAMGRHPLGKKLEPLVMNADEYSQLPQKDPNLNRQLEEGIWLWGTAW